MHRTVTDGTLTRNTPRSGCFQRESFSLWLNREREPLFTTVLATWHQVLLRFAVAYLCTSCLAVVIENMPTLIIEKFIP